MSPSTLTLRPSPHPASHAWRRGLASLLRSASRQLDQLATALATPASRRAAHELATSIEFAREACADEGAVYVDGVLVGYLSGVNRL
jgi:hypothetical protein